VRGEEEGDGMIGQEAHLNKLLHFVCDGRGDEDHEALLRVLYWPAAHA